MTGEEREQDGVPTLDQQIDELDALLPARDTAHAEVPVLDEPALAEEAGDEGTDAAPAATVEAPGPLLSPRQLVELSQRLQQRLDAELGDLTGIVRAVVRRCIQEELRRELPPARRAPAGAEPAVPATAEPGGDSPT